MSLSIRNQIPGIVTAIHPGGVLATVKVRLDGGQEITAAITREAVEALDLAEGTAVRVLVKSTEVALATDVVAGLSIRNQLPGKVMDISPGGVMASVKLAVPGGEITSVITNDAVAALDLAAGAPAVALIKSTEVSLATG